MRLHDRAIPGTPWTPLDAPAHNQICQVTLDYLADKKRPKEVIPRHNYIEVFNNTGNDLEEFQVAALKNPTFNPTDNPRDFRRRSVELRKPIAEDFGKFVVLAEDIPNGKMGFAYDHITIPCKVNITNQYHGYCDIKVDEYELTSSFHGTAQILWSESTTGTDVYSLIRIGVPRNVILLGKANAEVPPGGSGTVSIYHNETTDTGDDISNVQHQWLHNNDPTLDKISANNQVMILYSAYENAWRFLAAQCET
jgi:hypothetical protein